MIRGLYLGRFQPFHNGHLYMVREILKEVDLLIIGVCYNHKKNIEKDPYGVMKRISMIKYTLNRDKLHNFLLYPIEDNPSDKIWLKQFEDNVPKFDIIYMSDKNTGGEKKVENAING